MISPDAFTLKFELDMKKSLFVADELMKNESVKNASGDILNDAIEADLNEAKPCDDIDEDAFPSTAGDPPIVAGTRIQLALTLPNILTPSVIVPPLINT